MSQGRISWADGRMNLEHDQRRNKPSPSFLLLRDEPERQVDRMAKLVYGL